MKPKKLFVFIEAAQQDLVVSLLNLKHTMMNGSNGDKKVKFTRLFSYLSDHNSCGHYRQVLRHTIKWGL